MARRVSGRWSAIAVLWVSASCATTLSTVPFHEEPRQPTWALIYLYRPPAFGDGDDGMRVTFDDMVRGYIRPNAYFTLHAAPGTHWLQVGEHQSFMLGVTALNTPAGAVVLGLGEAIVAEAAQHHPIMHEFQARGGEAYYLHVSRKDARFVPRDEAIGTLQQMKYDRGGDADE
jgi:hypothetical protein